MGDYNWACFKAQQAAEFTLKAYLWGVGRLAFGRSLTRLLAEVGGPVPPREVKEACARLDKFYTAPRYADMWSEGGPTSTTPGRRRRSPFFYARTVMDYAESLWRSLREGGGRELRLKAAREFAEAVYPLIRPASVIVIGSTARGDFNEWSDVDVLMVSPRLPDNPLRRFDLVSGSLKPGIEPIPLRPEDLDRLLRKAPKFAEEVARGVALVDDLGVVGIAERAAASAGEAGKGWREKEINKGRR